MSSALLAERSAEKEGSENVLSSPLGHVSHPVTLLEKEHSLFQRGGRRGASVQDRGQGVGSDTVEDSVTLSVTFSRTGPGLDGPCTGAKKLSRRAERAAFLSGWTGGRSSVSPPVRKQPLR